MKAINAKTGMKVMYNGKQCEIVQLQINKVVIFDGEKYFTVSYDKVKEYEQRNIKTRPL